MRFNRYLPWILLLVLVLTVIGCSQPASAPAAPKPATTTSAPSSTAAPKAAPIILKAVAFTPLNNDTVAVFLQWIKRINDQAKGELTIQVVGGPEAIPALDQPEAVRKGVVDLADAAASYYQSILPEAAAFTLAQITIPEQRKSGYADMMVQLHKKVGLYYMGQLRHHVGFYIYTNKLVSKPQDLAGQKMRSVATYNAFMNALKIVPVTMAEGEIYTSLQQGVVDGYATAMSSVITLKLQEVTKYWINHPFYGGNNTEIMNLDKWNSLPKHLQDLMQNLMIQMESEAVTYYANAAEKERKVLADAGVKPITFSDADAKFYVDTAYNAAFAALKKAAPDTADKLKELSTKK